MKDEAKVYLDMLDVHVDPSKKLKDLRIGEQQLVEIAKAISLNSKIIVMDEPTSAISEKEAESCLPLSAGFAVKAKELFILHIEWKRYLRLRTGLRLCEMASISAQSRQRKHPRMRLSE